MAGFNKLHQLAASLDDRGTQLVSAYAAFWQNGASQLAPVDTGDLKGSVGHTMEGSHQARVSATMTYAIHQEFGTQDMPAQPFMRPAHRALEGPWKRDLKAVLDV